jgi:hypothetical protein
VDVATRFTLLRALKTKEAVSVATELLSMFAIFGIPHILQSDNGTEFLNAVITQLMELLHVEHRLIATYHPNANGLAERHVRTVKQMLFKTCQGDLLNFDLYLAPLQLALNSKFHSTTKSSPASLMFGREVNTVNVDAKVSEQSSDTVAQLTPMSMEELKKMWLRMYSIVWPTIHDVIAVNAKKTQVRVNSRRRIVKPFKLNDVVMRKNPTKVAKSDPVWLGPYKVVRLSQSGTYYLIDELGEELDRPVPVDQLKKLSAARAKTFGTDVYVVEDILGHRGIPGAYEFLVKWKNFPASSNSWVAQDQFIQQEIIKEYYDNL